MNRPNAATHTKSALRAGAMARRDALAAQARAEGSLAIAKGCRPIVEPDLILIPLVGFDQSGARLGHGQGFYDRALAAIHGRGRRPPLVGLAFSVQEVPRIPHEPHDIRLDWIVTEKETLDFTRKG